MKHRFVLFAWDTFYPAGGFGDAVSSHATIEEAKAAEKALRQRTTWDSTEIVDLLETAENGL